MKVGSLEISSMGGRVVVGPRQQEAGAGTGRGMEFLTGGCQEIGLVGLMFFFELLFSYVSLQIPSMFFFTNLFSIILFLIC